MAVHSPPGGTRFSQHPLAFLLEVKRLKRGNKEEGRGAGQEAAKKVPALVTEHSCFQDLREVLGRAQPLPRHDAFFIAVDQRAGSTGALCPVPSNFPLLLKMGLCSNSHTVSVML